METKKIIGMLRNCADPDGSCMNCEMYMGSAACTAKLLTIAADAMEKQIPKKIQKPGSGNGYICPVCSAFWATYKGNFIDTNYCPSCGQAIDWGDYE